MPQHKQRTFLVPGLILTISGAGVACAVYSGTATKITLLLALIVFLSLALATLYFVNFNRRIAAEEGRNEIERNLRTVIHSIKDYAIFLVDPEGRVTSWNQGAQRIKGYTEAEIIGKPISVFYTDEEARSGEPFRNLLRAAEDGRFESVGLRKRKDGSFFFADVVFTPMYDDNNRLKGFIKITRDITDQKAAESNMLGALQREKELNDLKSRFVTLASHEFKTPLSVILSSTNLIEKYTGEDMQENRLKHTQRIRSNVNNMKQILNDFLSLEKLETGIIENTPAKTRLPEFLHKLIEEMEEARKEGQQIHLHIEGETRVVPVDTQLLRNILNNLISNAIKYSSEQGAIDCTLRFEPRAISIAIRDQGIGIPAGEQAHLFERFFRASNTVGISGTGLGLSIVRRYLDLVGGEISVESRPGEGSTFTVHLPEPPAGPASTED